MEPGAAKEAIRAAAGALATTGLTGTLPLLAVCWLVARLLKAPALLIPGYMTMGLASALAYWLDKRRAQKQAERVSEGRLLMLDYLGGWIGGLVAQRALRHKNRKLTYQAKFWMLVVCHVLCVAWVFAR